MPVGCRYSNSDEEQNGVFGLAYLESASLTSIAKMATFRNNGAEVGYWARGANLTGEVTDTIYCS